MPVAVTVTSVTPSEGVPGGRNLVVIQGTGFDADTQRMRVQFGGVESSRVRVRNGLSEPATWDQGTILDAIIPLSPLTANGSVLVEVFNDATSLSGQLPDGYTFKRPDLAVKSHIGLVFRTLIDGLKRDVLEEVMPVPAWDWSRPGAVDQARSKAPALVVEGPRSVPTTFPEDNAPIVTDDDDNWEWDQQRETRRHDLEFTITAITRGADGGLEQALALIRWVDDFIRRNPKIEVPDVEGSTELHEYELAMVTSWQPIDVGTDLFAYVATIRVEGVGIQVGEVIDAGAQFQVTSSPTIQHVDAPS